eukprot:371183_1
MFLVFLMSNICLISYHLLYFNLKLLNNTISSIINYLKPNGICAISNFSDNDKCVEMYNKLSPKYQLSTTIENILKNNKCVYKKYFEHDTYTMSTEDHFTFLKWLTIQDCMNENYIPNGLTPEINKSIDQHCRKFMNEKMVKNVNRNGQEMYTNTYTSVHFLVSKKALSKL